MRWDISIINRHIMNSFTGFNRYLGIHIGDIISPRGFLPVSDISASLSPSNAIGFQATLDWFTFEPLESPVSLFGCIFTNIRKPWFIKTFWHWQSLRDSLVSKVLQDESEHGIIRIVRGR